MRNETRLGNNLKAMRTRLGLGKQQLAGAAGVTRQTISGIEEGLYAPTTAVALRLAKALGCRVEDLFWLEDDLPTVEAFPAGAIPEHPSRVTLAQIGGRWIAHPLVGEQAFRSEMIPADGIGARMETGETLSVKLLDDPENLARTVFLAGCTPALSLWARAAERRYPGLRVPWRHANSTAALESLARGEIHAAGVHLCDPVTGETNTPYVRQVIPDRPVVLISLGVWEEGLLVAAGNPKRLRGGADLAREDVRLVNREVGAGSRLMLDALLEQDRIPPAAISGYEEVVAGHQEVARAVLEGRADIGVSTASIAAMYGLSFVPLRRVRYDLALLKEYLALEPVRQLLGTLNHRWVRSQLQVLGGYDTTLTGDIVAEI